MKVYAAHNLTGGTTGTLDAIKGTGLLNNDIALVQDATYGFLVYLLDDDSGAAESAPDVITPDTDAGNKRWLLQSPSVTAFGSSLMESASADAALTILGLSAFGKTLIDDADATELLGTIGLDVDLLTFSIPASTTISAFGASIIDDANAAAVLATLGLDASLATLSLPDSTTISAFAKTILDDADAAAVIATLGLSSWGGSILGYREGLLVTAKDTDEIYISGGAIEMSGTLYKSDSQLTFPMGAVSASTMYYIYVGVPGSGTTLGTVDFEKSATVPLFSDTLGYHTKTGDTALRYVARVYIGAGSTISFVSYPRYPEIGYDTDNVPNDNDLLQYNTTTGLWEATAPASIVGLVTDNLYDANTIVKADADNTPEALTVGPGTIVGRMADGEISALDNVARGFREGLDITVADATNLYVSGGVIEIAGSFYESEAQLTVPLGTITADTLYYIYVEKPATGVTLAAGDFTVSLTAPTFNNALGADYMTDDATKRYVGRYVEITA